MRVLIAYDGSAGAAQAVALVAGVNWLAGSALRVVSVVEPAILQLMPWTMGATAPQALAAEALAYVQADQATVVGRLSAPDRVVDADRVHRLVVVGRRDGGPVGVISESDIVREVAASTGRG